MNLSALRFPVFAAACVHVFTASGLIFGFLALIATVEGAQGLAFLWLGLALLVDGIDGSLARWAQVRIYTPQIDGATLDNVIDFFTYAIIPALMIWQWGLAPAGLQTLAGCMVILAAGYTYAQTGMKAPDHCFVGFPALWNVLVFFLVLFDMGSWVSFGLISLCAGLTLVPTSYIHPLRTPLYGHEWINWVAALIWIVSAAVLGSWVLYLDGAVTDSKLWLTGLIASSCYFAGLSFAWPLVSKNL